MYRDCCQCGGRAILRLHLHHHTISRIEAFGAKLKAQFDFLQELLSRQNVASARLNVRPRGGPMLRPRGGKLVQ